MEWHGMECELLYLDGEQWNGMEWHGMAWNGMRAALPRQWVRRSLFGSVRFMFGSVRFCSDHRVVTALWIWGRVIDRPGVLSSLSRSDVEAPVLLCFCSGRSGLF